MSWLFLAILGHLSNAVAFIIDKTLLSTVFKRSATYAAMIGGLSLIVVLTAPWVRVWPMIELWPAVLAFGGLFVLALWAFFEALKGAEASRVVPIIGSLIPIFTLIGTFGVFGERLSFTQLVGFMFLVAATWMLTYGGARHLIRLKTLMAAIVAAILFAASTVFGKYVFEHTDFFGAFVASRIVAGFTGIALGILVPGVGLEIMRAFSHKPSKPQKSSGLVLLVVGQLFGAIGFLLVHLAIKFGSAAIVNALQAVQYAFIVLVAWFGGTYLRRLLKEERTTQIIVVKSIAIGLVALGLALVAER